jgi:hypothetical protein
LEEEFLHPLIPLERIDSEYYKSTIINKYLKKPQIQKFKTDSCQAMNIFNNPKRKFSSFQDGCMSMSLSKNAILFTKRKISSCKRIYESTLTFFDSNRNLHNFKLYNDNESGFDARFNQILKHMEMDNDVESDEDQLLYAKNYTIDNLRLVMNKFSTKELRNKMKFKRSRSAVPKKIRKSKI